MTDSDFRLSSAAALARRTTVPAELGLGELPIDELHIPNQKVQENSY